LLGMLLIVLLPSLEADLKKDTSKFRKMGKQLFFYKCPLSFPFKTFKEIFDIFIKNLFVSVPLPDDASCAVAPRVPLFAAPPPINPKLATLGVRTKSLAMLRVSAFGARAELPTPA